MSSNLKAPNENAPRTEVGQTVEEKKKIFDLSLTQVVGGALAAMTAAALGSTLGVAGTIVGAALASVVAGVAGSLYTASLRTGRDKVRTVFRVSTPDASSTPDAASAPPSLYYQPQALDETKLSPIWEPVPAENAAKDKKADKHKTGTRFPWKRAVAISLAVFALAAVLITGYERVSGQPLSGGKGTTVSQVRDDTSSDKESKPSPSPSSTSPTAQPSSPAASATPGVGEAPSASESADSSTPSAGPSTPEATPSPSAAGVEASAPAGQ